MFAVPKMLTVFRYRRVEGVDEEYLQWAVRMGALAGAVPGHLRHKTFTADDGERVTIAEFDSFAAHQAWSRHPDHLEAKRKGRADFYVEYTVQVCEVVREGGKSQPA